MHSDTLSNTSLIKSFLSENTTARRPSVVSFSSSTVQKKPFAIQCQVTEHPVHQKLTMVIQSPLPLN